MTFTTCKSYSALREERKKCLESQTALYPGLHVIGDKEEEILFATIIREYKGDLNHNSWSIGVLRADIIRCYMLRDNQRSLYMDTDVMLHHHLDNVDGDTAAFGFNGAVADPHIMYSGIESAVYDQILTKWIQNPPSRGICTSIIWYFDRHAIRYNTIKSGYEHLALGSAHGWSNE